jgi:hypothetical protein
MIPLKNLERSYPLGHGKFLYLLGKVSRSERSAIVADQASSSRDGKKIFAHQYWETEEFGNRVEFDVPELR